ncbi:MAG: 3-deoxy-7-phosphoheptulonate synthase [Planctomycetia bacterium]|nr:3-deoxy-7-phosphoheptulonate synthase [Planctomycetia bacterium]
MNAMKNLKLCSLEGRPLPTCIEVGKARIGENFTIMAGPCSVETMKQTMETAIAVREAGADILRGGVFKPRTSPYDFQGLGLEGLRILRKAANEVEMPIVTEVIDPRDIPWVAEYADILQIGTRNMQNFSLLKEAGRSYRPVLLKRGMHSTIAEWLNCAEYILAEGNPNVILCERGIRTFEGSTRNTLDLSAIPNVQRLTHLPVIVDPSHATGRRELIEPMSLAALAAGADGLEIEVHACPDEALCDGAQSLTPEMFKDLMKKLRYLDNALKSYEE